MADGHSYWSGYIDADFGIVAEWLVTSERPLAKSGLSSFFS
jgi:hypothetical protein